MKLECIVTILVVAPPNVHLVDWRICVLHAFCRVQVEGAMYIAAWACPDFFSYSMPVSVIGLMLLTRVNVGSVWGTAWQHHVNGATLDRSYF